LRGVGWGSGRFFKSLKECKIFTTVWEEKLVVWSRGANELGGTALAGNCRGRDF